MKESKRTQRRKRVLLNCVARKSKHRSNRFAKFLLMHKIVIPMSSEPGWTWSEKDDCIVDRGGPVALYRHWNSALSDKERLKDDPISELRKCKEVLYRDSTRPPIVRRWSEDLVKLNWTGELVPWDTIKHRVVR